MNDETNPTGESVTEEAIHHLVPADIAPQPQTNSLAVSLTRAEIDQQIATAKQFPRSTAGSVEAMVSMATMNSDAVEESIYAVPRGGKTIRGPSIRFAEIVAQSWGNCRDAARVTHVDRIERWVEAEALFHDLQTNRATTTRVKRTIELKKNKRTLDLDMIALAGAAAMSIARRNAILGGVPKAAWKKAYDAVESVIRGDVKTLVERRDRAMGYFHKAGVPPERVLRALELRAVDDITLEHLVTMQGWRTAIGSGEATAEEIFPEERPAQGPKEDKLKRLAEPHEPHDAEASRKQASEQEAGASPSSAPPASDPAGASPKARAQAARLNALIAQGDEAAVRGKAAVREWLDALPGDDQAMIGPVLEKRFIDAAGERP